MNEAMVSAEDDDDYYYYYDGFDNYVPKTIDPGPWMLIGVSVYSLICIIVLPFFVVIGNRRERRRMLVVEKKLEGDDLEQDSSISSSSISARPLQAVDYKGPRIPMAEPTLAKPIPLVSTTKAAGAMVQYSVGINRN